jgi:hypothetical protein
VVAVYEIGWVKMTEPKEKSIISVGLIVGGPEFTPWREQWVWLSDRFELLSAGVESPLKVNVSLHVPGSVLSPDYEGVRTGSFSKKQNLLRVQIALPLLAPEDPRKFLQDRMFEAIDAAEALAIRRKYATNLNALRDIVKRLL